MLVQVSEEAWVDPDAVRAVEDADRNDEWKTSIAVQVGDRHQSVLSKWTPSTVINELSANACVLLPRWPQQRPEPQKAG